MEHHLKKHKYYISKPVSLKMADFCLVIYQNHGRIGMQHHLKTKQIQVLNKYILLIFLLLPTLVPFEVAKVAREMNWPRWFYETNEL